MLIASIKGKQQNPSVKKMISLGVGFCNIYQKDWLIERLNKKYKIETEKSIWFDENATSFAPQGYITECE